MARPMTAYIDQGWKPQWKKAYSIATRALSGVLGSPRPGGMLPALSLVR